MRTREEADVSGLYPTSLPFLNNRERLWRLEIIIGGRQRQKHCVRRRQRRMTRNDGGEEEGDWNERCVQTKGGICLTVSGA